MKKIIQISASSLIMLGIQACGEDSSGPEKRESLSSGQVLSSVGETGGSMGTEGSSAQTKLSNGENSSNSIEASSQVELSSEVQADYCGDNPDKCGTFKDSRDDQEYTWAQIGSQVWMSKNLNYVVDSSFCYENKPENCDKYGRLYKWHAAMDSMSSSKYVPSERRGICPEGWHVPSLNEWLVMMRFITDEHNLPGEEYDDWLGVAYYLKNGHYGFNPQYAGERYATGTKFGLIDNSDAWWSTTDDPVSDMFAMQASVWNGKTKTEKVTIERQGKALANPLRCLKDSESK